uniref:Zinc transporter ZIP11 n=1 Tax=Plectus sambesii TaxID=2011161 RepID=A0A914XR11_9BILA
MIRGINPIWQALLATLYTWGMTALGAAVVFILPNSNKKVLDVGLGFASGVMAAASFWGLLTPAIDVAESTMGRLALIPVLVGFIVGAVFVFGADLIIAFCGGSKETSVVSLMRVNPVKSPSDVEMSNDKGREEEKANKEMEETAKELSIERALSWRRMLLLIVVITLHNVPEGLAVGISFGSAGKSEKATYESAFNLALAVGLQNLPEGLAVSLPLTGFGYSKWQAFAYGQLSGMVEPLSAVIGAAAVTLIESIMPYALAFAAGAMICVVIDDII